LTVSPDPLLDAITEEIGLSFWVRRDGSNSLDGFPVGRRRSGSSQIHFQVRTDQGGQPRLNFQFSGDGQGPPGYSAYSVPDEVSETLNDGGWHHIGISHEFGVEKQPRIFVDGVERPVQRMFGSPGFPAAASGQKLGIGHTPDTGKRFRGILDDFRLYGRTLTSQDIAELCDFAPACG